MLCLLFSFASLIYVIDVFVFWHSSVNSWLFSAEPCVISHLRQFPERTLKICFSLAKQLLFKITGINTDITMQ